MEMIPEKMVEFMHPHFDGQKLYSFILNLLSDAFRLDFADEEIYDDHSKLKVFLAQLKSRLEQLFEMNQKILFQLSTVNSLHFCRTKEIRADFEWAKMVQKCQQDIVDIVTKIEKEQYVLSPSLRFKMGTILPVLKLLLVK